jgi:hypothetical protein
MSTWESPKEWAEQNRERVMAKLRKLAALRNDDGSTEGERAGCLAAMERLKQYVTPSEFEQATCNTNAEEEFVKKAHERKARRTSGFQRYQEEQRRRDFVRNTVNSFAHQQWQHMTTTHAAYFYPGPASEYGHHSLRSHDAAPSSVAGSQAYPSAYGPKK